MRPFQFNRCTLGSHGYGANALTFMLAVLATPVAGATNPEALLTKYRAEAAKADGAFKGFTVEAGKALYTLERTRDGAPVSCTTCHTADPRLPGQSRAGKQLEPLAPRANPQRFTDEAKVEKWFRRNCNDVLGRECTAREKGDFITYLLSVK